MLSGPTPPSADSGAFRKPCAATSHVTNPPCIQVLDASSRACKEQPFACSTAGLGLTLLHAYGLVQSDSAAVSFTPACGLLAQQGQTWDYVVVQRMGAGALRTRTSGASFSSLSRRL